MQLLPFRFTGLLHVCHVPRATTTTYMYNFSEQTTSRPGLVKYFTALRFSRWAKLESRVSLHETCAINHKQRFGAQPVLATTVPSALAVPMFVVGVVYT